MYNHINQVSDLLTALGRFLVLNYGTASAIEFTFIIANLTRVFMAANLLVSLIDMDSVYVCYSNFNQSVYGCPVPYVATNSQA